MKNKKKKTIIIISATALLLAVGVVILGIGIGLCLATGMTLSDGQQARAIVSQYVDDAPHYELLVSPSFTSMCCANCYDELGEFWNVLWFFR